MKRFSIYIVLCTLSLSTLLSSCGVYRKYKSQTEVPDDLYGSGDSIAQAAMADSATIADISWREFFRDPLLQTKPERVKTLNILRIPGHHFQCCFVNFILH